MAPGRKNGKSGGKERCATNGFFWFGAAVLLAVVAVPVVAHHAFGAEFDRNAPIKLQGKIVKLEWVNPHTWIHIEAEMEDGSKEVWAVEGGTPNVLLRRGLRRDCLKPGTEIIVDGYQAKDHSLKRARTGAT